MTTEIRRLNVLKQALQLQGRVITTPTIGLYPESIRSSSHFLNVVLLRVHKGTFFHKRLSLTK